MASWQAYVGIVAGVLALVPCIFYIRGMVRGKTKPDRVTWWVLTLVSGMITASYFAAGARETVWFPAAYTLSFFTIAVFSLKYGEGDFVLHTLDRICLAGALISALVWWSTSIPFLSLVMNICTEFIGLMPTIIKAYKRPQTEDSTAWVVATIASAVNLLAVSVWIPTVALYPVYVFVSNAVVLYPIIRKK